mgnify:CR=1 FL=1
MLLFSVIVAGSFSLGSIIANQVSPGALTAVRFLIAFCIIGSIAALREGIPRTAFKSTWRYFVLGGVFITYFVLMFEALKTAPPVSTSAVFTLTPLFSAVAGYFLLKQFINTRIAFALFIGAIGAIWTIFRADIGSLIKFNIGTGELIFVVACIFHAIYTPLVRKLNRGETPLVFTAGTLLAGTLLLFLVFWKDIVSISWVNLPFVFWVCLLYLAIFASAVTNLLIHHYGFTIFKSYGLHLPNPKLGCIVGVNTWKPTPNAPCVNRTTFNNSLVVAVIERINLLEINKYLNP